MRRVVVTGIGVVSAIGLDTTSYTAGLRESRPGTGLITRLDRERYHTQVGAEVVGLGFDHLMPPGDQRHIDRQSLLAVEAAQQAVDAAGFTSEPDPFRCGCILGTGMGPAEAVEESVTAFHVEHKKPRPTMIPKMMDNAAVGHVSMRFRCRGASQMIVTACSASAHALGQAMLLIRHGACDACLAGGSEAFPGPALFAAWDSMRVMSRSNDRPQAACRPFSRDREGFVMGEGAAVMVLESEERARARGAEILGELAGVGLSSDAHHITQPQSDGQQAAIRAALDDARIRPEQVGYINAHGTATLINDPLESQSIRAAYGPAAEQIPVSSTKSALGHTIGAAGALEAAATLLAMGEGFVPATLHLDEVDPECRLCHVPGTAREHRFDIGVSHSFAFGGHNVVLVLRRYAG